MFKTKKIEFLSTMRSYRIALFCFIFCPLQLSYSNWVFFFFFLLSVRILWHLWFQIKVKTIPQELTFPFISDLLIIGSRISSALSSKMIHSTIRSYEKCLKAWQSVKSCLQKLKLLWTSYMNMILNSRDYSWSSRRMSPTC